MNIADRPAAARAVTANAKAETTAKTADLTVVGGAGHVGIPLVLSFAAKGSTVNVNDLNEQTLATLKAGNIPFIENGAQPLLTKALADQRLFFTSRPEDISTSGPVIITIGTPVDEFLNPVRGVVQECIDALLPHLRDGQLIVLRSTLYPGTTDWVDAHIKRQGRNLKVAFCPERIVQGQGIEELARMPQIVSGTSPEAEQEAAALFGLIAPELTMLKPIEAEFAKLFTNAYRYIGFAITNQFYLIAKSAGLDYHQILQAMKLNYPRANYIPTPGFAAGPCLVKDTMQLLAFARNEFGLGNAAIMVNEGLPLHIVAELNREHDLSKMTVGLLGVAFKAESDDPRASLSYKLKKALSGAAREVLTTDPLVTTDPDLLPLETVIARSDLLILCTPHQIYRTADLRGKPVVDVWGVLGNANVIR
ncbi:MAG: nucleotide sugar dehydrogenase [Alphaproteobacteria bacterium]|nr:nucleotide sugar dehydrogenase [Alphaproteobacteria bacterium]